MIIASVVLNPNFTQTYGKNYGASAYTKFENGLYITTIPSNLTMKHETNIVFGVNNTSSLDYSLIPLSDIPKATVVNYRTFNTGSASNNGGGTITYSNVPTGSYAFVTPHDILIVFSVVPQSTLYLASYIGFAGAGISISSFISLVVFLRLNKK